MDETDRQLGSYRLQERQSPDHWIGTHVRLGHAVTLRRLTHLTADQRERLRAGVQHLDRLRPPRLAHVHELIDDPDEDGEGEGVLWLVSERLEGPTLAEQIRSGPLPIAAVQALAEDLLPSLAIAHAEGLVHGSISPLQIRLTPQGPCLQGCVTAPLDERSALHMAPELWSRRAPSPASDLYSLGLCLYEALIGTSPFPPGLPRSEYARLHTQGAVPDVRVRRPEVPPALADLIQAATQRAPRDRPPHALAALSFLLPPPPPPPLPSDEAVGAVLAPGGDVEEEVRRRRPSSSSLPVVSGLLFLPLSLGLLLAAACGVGAWWQVGEGGVAALLHRGPRLELHNTTAEPLTLACTAGVAGERVGAIVGPQARQVVLLAGAPAECIAFDAGQTVWLRWSAEDLPPEGTAWQATIPQDSATPMPDIRLEGGFDTGEAPAALADGRASPPPPLPPPPSPLPPSLPARPRAEATPGAVLEEAAVVGLVVGVDTERRWLARNIEVRVDGERVGLAPVTWAVAPGDHEVRWYKAGRLDLTCTVRVPAAGRTVQIDPEAPACP